MRDNDVMALIEDIRQRRTETIWIEYGLKI